MFELFERNDTVNNFHVKKKKSKSDLYSQWYRLDFLNLSIENSDTNKFANTIYV